MPLSLVHKPVFYELPPRPGQTIMVCGSGRSGTTWIGDVIASMTKSRVLFEPFILDKSGEYQLGYLTRVDLDSRRERPHYISPASSIDPFIGKRIASVIFGDHRCGWVNQNLKPGIYLRRLVKEIRVNLFLATIAELWPSIRIVYLVRSPYKVVDSMIEKGTSGWMFEWDIEDILKQENLIGDWLYHFVDRIGRVKTLPERLMVRWCIENYVALNQLQGKDNVLVIGYEQLLEGEGWADVGAFLSDKGWVGEPSIELLNRPSRAGAKPLAVGSGATLKHLDEKAVSDITDLLHLFGFPELLPEMQQTWAGSKLRLAPA